MSDTHPPLSQDQTTSANPSQDWAPYTRRAQDWFESLRTQICAEFEAIEREAAAMAGSEGNSGPDSGSNTGPNTGSNSGPNSGPPKFEFTPWLREEEGNPDPGGGTRGVMKGKVFEKVGVNVSSVRGNFSPEFASNVNGASAQSPGFTATGISLVAHMANPHVPAVHMNTRFLTTQAAWFGGGADLNPPIPYEQDTLEFHAAFRAACAAHNPTYYDRFKKWADEYFYIPHRECHRGVGGIFYDHLECGDAKDAEGSAGAEGSGDFEGAFAGEGSRAAFDRNFTFTQDVGKAFLDIFPKLVRRRMGQDFTPDDKQRQLEWRGRYAEFNLVYDRGTLFGLKTGGNIDAILMSLPPEAVWS